MLTPRTHLPRGHIQHRKEEHRGDDPRQDARERRCNPPKQDTRCDEAQRGIPSEAIKRDGHELVIKHRAISKQPLNRGSY